MHHCPPDVGGFGCNGAFCREGGQAESQIERKEGGKKENEMNSCVELLCWGLKLVKGTAMGVEAKKGEEESVLRG